MCKYTITMKQIIDQKSLKIYSIKPLSIMKFKVTQIMNLQNFTKVLSILFLFAFQTSNAQRTVKELIRYTLTGPAGIDYTVIYFDTVCTNLFDSKGDAYKLPGNSLNVYSVDNAGIKYSINGNSAYTNSMSIPIAFKVSKPGTYTLTVVTHENPERYMSTSLVNISTGSTYSTNLNQTADFVVDNSMVNVTISNMFRIDAHATRYGIGTSFARIENQDDNSMSSKSVGVFPNPTTANAINIQTVEYTTFSINTLDGQMVYQNTFNAGTNQKLDLSNILKTGSYLVVFRDEKNKITREHILIE